MENQKEDSDWDCLLLSREALAKNWDTPEDDEAWKDL